MRRFVRLTTGVAATVALTAGSLLALPDSASAADTSFVDSTTSDFDAGVTEDTLSSADTADGALTLAPGSADFDGDALPDGWTFAPVTTGSGSAAVSAGALTVDSGTVVSDENYAVGRTIEFRAKFTGPDQRVGLSVAGAEQSFIGVKTVTSDNATRFVFDRGPESTAPLAPPILNEMHTFRISWTPSTIKFWILDDPQVPSYSAYSTGYGNWLVNPLRTAISDLTSDANTLQVESFSALAAPGPSSHFDNLDPAYTSTTLTSPSGGAFAANGSVNVLASEYVSNTTVLPGTTVDIQATLPDTSASGDTYRGVVGLKGGDPQLFAYFNAVGDNVRADVSFTSGTTLSQTFPLTPGLLGQSHTFRITVNVESVVLSVLDMPSLTPLTFNGNMRFPMYVYVKSLKPELPVNLDDVAVGYSAFTNADFSSNPNWASIPLTTGGNSSTAGGVLTVDQARTGESTAYGPGRTLEFDATFSGAANQVAGWGRTLATGQQRANIETNSAGQLLANANGTTSVLSATIPTGQHHYKIDWTGTGYTFTVTDIPSITPLFVGATYYANMRPVFSDDNTLGNALVVDNFVVSSIVGRFTSRVFDYGNTAEWKSASWTAAVPQNSGAAFSIRSGDTPTPDATWSAFTTVGASGQALSNVIGRYAQYRVELSSRSQAASPSVQDVTLTAEHYMNHGFVDTTVSDFSAGTLGTTSAIADGNGAVSLNRPVYQQFDGTTMPAGWSGSGATVHDGMITIDNGTLTNGISYGFGTTIEFYARISGNRYGSQNMAGGWNGAWYAGCGSGTSGLCLRTYPNYYGWKDAPAASGTWNRFRITFTASQTIFYVNGNWAATQGPTGNTTMFPWFWDNAYGYGALDIDWVSITPFDFPTTQTFTSRVFDGGQLVCWGNLGWDADTPLNSTVAMKVRTGNTPTPDSTWSPYRSVAQSDDPIRGSSRYVQYSAALYSSEGDAVPSLREVRIGGGDYGPCASVTDTTKTDFDSGVGSNLYPSTNAVTPTASDLAPPVGSTDFPGAELPAGWRNHVAVSPYNPGQGAHVANNVLNVNNAEVVNENSLSSGHSLEFTATFRYPSYQEAGFSSAMFLVTNGELRTSTGGGGGDYALWGGSYLNTSHRYRIDWVGNTASFYVDGNFLVTHPAPAGNRNVRFFDDAVANSLDVSDVDITNYSASGSYDSRIIDEGASVTWNAINWDADVPVGTSLTVQVRTGNTAAPDGSWTGFSAVTNGASLNTTSRYLQYRVLMSTTTNDTVPALHSITVDRV